MSTDNVTAITSSTPRKPKAAKKVPPPKHPFIQEGDPDTTISYVKDILQFLAWHEMDTDSVAEFEVAGEVNAGRFFILSALAGALEHVNKELEAERKARREMPAG